MKRVEETRKDLDRREAENKVKIDNLDQKIKTPEAQKFIEEKTREYSEKDKERVKLIESIDKHINNLDGRAKELREFNKGLDCKMWNTKVSINGDVNDVSNLLKQSEKIQNQITQSNQQTIAINTRHGITR